MLGSGLGDSKLIQLCKDEKGKLELYRCLLRQMEVMNGMSPKQAKNGRRRDAVEPAQKSSSKRIIMASKKSERVKNIVARNTS